MPDLTPEQERLYARLKDYCNQHHMWCGNAAQLASFADLPYPFHPDVVHELLERKLIESHAIPFFYLTVCKPEESHATTSLR